MWKKKTKENKKASLVSYGASGWSTQFSGTLWTAEMYCLDIWGPLKVKKWRGD